MPLTSGTRLGSYEIVSLLGVGGMGEVYRAHDPALNRDVAIKVLPEEFVTDPDRVARFKREAQVLASLNHPNIAQIYGFEDSGAIKFLVMELVDGQTLAQKLAHGSGLKAQRLPADEGLAIAQQIADALEAAHEKAITHRDLKPANIMLTAAEGRVKVLDFGLAKFDAPTGGGPGSASYTHSPTLTALPTQAGVILGSAAYMSPEQAKGRAADKRSDVWAFGCVLYEMLTGTRAFSGEDVSDTLAAVLRGDPDWTVLPSETPEKIRALLRRCLQKDRTKRLRDIGDARLEIDDAISSPASQQTPAASTVAQHSTQRFAWSAAALALVVALGIGVLHFTERPPEPLPTIRFDVVAPANASLGTGTQGVLSPDGRLIAFGVGGGGQGRLAVRAFEWEEARELPGTERQVTAFWSPDSQFMGFVAGGQLKKISVNGARLQTIADLPPTTGRAAWNRDDIILIGQPNGGLLRVSGSGGSPVPATELDTTRLEIAHQGPSFLPDGRRFLFRALAQSGAPPPGVSAIYVGSLDGGQPKVITAADSPAIYAEGFLLFVRGGTLFAQPFDADRLTTTGDAVAVAQDVTGFSASGTGLLSYRSASSGVVTSRIMSFDRNGKLLGTIGEEADQSALRLSPDGTKLAVSVLDPVRRSRDIWIHELTRDGLRTKLTFDPGEDWSAAWSPDGANVAFSAARPGTLDVYRKRSDGSGSEERLLEMAGNQYVQDWSRDGRFVLIQTGTTGSRTGNDLWVLSLDSGGKSRPLLQSESNEGGGRLSPAGRWVAYTSNESGRNEVHVTSFPAASGKWQVSTTGGEMPKWRGDGKELFYLAGNAMMAADVNGAGQAFQIGAVRRLFEVRRRTQAYVSRGLDPGFANIGTSSVYDVSPDGQRFFVNVLSEAQDAPPPITVITNWTATLR